MVYIHGSSSRDKETLSRPRHKVHGMVTSTHPRPRPTAVYMAWSMGRGTSVVQYRGSYENGYTFFFSSSLPYSVGLWCWYAGMLVHWHYASVGR